MKLLSKFFFFPALIALFFLASCDDDNSSSPTKELGAKIAVFSDPHLLAPSLGSSGVAFQTYISMDRKMIAESDAILASLVETIKNSDVEIVLVPGDLTKDGEKASHELFAQYMADIESTGKEVYVIPGNHDVNNPGSYSYQGDEAVSTPTVSASEFASIYADFGYSEAIAKDPNSLSYVVEPSEGLWLIGMDGCRYSENDGKGHSVTGGKFSDATLAWIKDQIAEGKSQGKMIFGMLHHGILEHFPDQKTNPISAEYVIDNWEAVSAELASAGMQVVFTGHFHSNDIVEKDFGSSKLYDIETGSTVTYPCPYRYLTLTKDRTLEVTTHRIENINYDTQGKTFQEYAKDFLTNGLVGIVQYTLQNDFGLDEATATMLAPFAVELFVNHYEGDEEPSQELLGLIATLKSSSDQMELLMGALLESMAYDTSPADNNVVLDLNETH